MRLIDTQTHLLLEPWKATGKEYAILSHTWGDQEVIFQEWEQLYPSGAIKGQCPHVRHQGIDKKSGYFKVMQACEQAQRDGIRYLWCDTMCINKESSAELSEAINSMFKWYRVAKVCYVYLTDVTFPGRISYPTKSNVPGWFSDDTARLDAANISEIKSRFMASRWWTRGWTLQELLAPKNVVFFAQDWTVLGHKSGMAHWISTSTSIHREALEDHTTIRRFSIAQRMSWAANRTTTVVEDTAYCLLGIFEINMPMLYGQGDGAFRKLQHEIIKISDDQSIFAWSADRTASIPWTGALAQSPRNFKHCGSIVRDSKFVRQPYSLTNVGFKMRALMILDHSTSQYYMGLGCFLELHGKGNPPEYITNSHKRVRIWIPVRQRDASGFYERIHSPLSHIYFQYSYPTNKVVNSPEIFLCELPSRTSPIDSIESATSFQIFRVGIAASVGFGNMSTVSRVYKDTWQPPNFRIIPIGSRGPSCLSHEIIVSGSYCVILSAAWDRNCKPYMHRYTTLRDSDEESLPALLDQLKIGGATRKSDDVNTVHERLRLANQDAVTNGQSSDSPMVVVEDEPLYDMHGSASVIVDIIFKEKPKGITSSR